MGQARLLSVWEESWFLEVKTRQEPWEDSGDTDMACSSGCISVHCCVSLGKFLPSLGLSFLIHKESCNTQMNTWTWNDCDS